jgi:hypothetical protein
MSTISLRLPESLRASARELRARAGRRHYLSVR